MSAAQQNSLPRTMGGKSILVVDDAPFCREMTAAALKGQGFKALVADNGIDGLKLLETNHADLIILDSEMPKMSGLEFLKVLREDPRWKRTPVIMLTSNSSKEIITQAGKFGVCGYMLKLNFSLPTLMQRVNGALGTPQFHAPSASSKPAPAAAAAPKSAVARPPAPAPTALSKATEGVATPPAVIPNMVPRSTTLATIAELDSAKTLAGVAMEISALTDAPSTNFSDLSAALKQDPILSSRVLQMANSAAYVGSKGKLANLDDAVRNIGAAAVRTIALSAGVFDAFPTDKADGLDLLRCWQHSFGVAAIMGQIVPRIDGVASGMPFLIGLCHDLPELMLRQRFPTEFAFALDYAVRANKPFKDVLSKVFGVSYAELSGELFERMKVPQNVSDPLKEFCRPEASRSESPIVRALLIANEYAHGIFLTPSAEATVSPVLQTDCRVALISKSAIDGPRIRLEAISSTCMLAKLSAAQEAEVLKPILPQRNTHVWYVRHSAFAGIDPVEAALSNLCTVKAYDHSPRAADRSQLQGLVLAAPSHEAAHELLSETHSVRDSAEELPILILTPAGQPGLNQLPAGVEEANFPISLSRLHKFVARLKEGA